VHVNYRIANLADLPAICALGSEVNLFHHVALPDVFAQPNEPERDVEIWRKVVDGEQSVAFVAERSSTLIGFVTAELVDETLTLFHPARFCRVGTLGVVLAERGRGIGSALMAALEQWAISHSASGAHLNVWKFNEAAIRLYVELGYEAKAQFMVKFLAPPAA
jgi:ribosomal protein S18 acetylase RimI-like enzyme